MNTTTDPKTETIADAFDRLMRENAEQAAEIARLRKLIEDSNLEEVRAGGQIVGMDKPRYMQVLRPRDEVAKAEEGTKQLQKMASMAREIARLRTCAEAGCNSDAVYPPICVDCDLKDGMEMMRQAKIEVLREVRDYLFSVGYRDTGDDAEIEYLDEKLKALEAGR